MFKPVDLSDVGREGTTHRLLTGLARRVAGVVLARPLVTVLFGLALGAGAALLAAQIRFDTRFDALMPQSDPVVREARELQDLAGGTVELVIAVGSEDKTRRMAFSRELVARLKQRSWIRRADVEFPVDFFYDRRMWLAPLRTLRELRDEIDVEIERARARANPLYVDLEDDEEEGGGKRDKPWAAVERRQNSPESKNLLKKTFTSKDGRYLFVRVKPMGNTMDMAAGRVMMERIRREVAAVGPERHGVEVRYAGGLVSNQDQNDRMTRDFKVASVIALGGIVLLMTLYIRRVGAPLIIAGPLLVGVACAVAFAQVTVGQFNLVTGFLVSVLFGLGIDFEIHLYLRYLELLPDAADRREAMTRAMVRTLPGCATAAFTSAAAFYAMTISDFRGFWEFGLIAGTGVLLTLATTYTLLPPLALILGRKGRRPAARLAGGGLRFGVAVAVVAVGAGLLVAGAVLAPRARWHNDFRALRGTSEVLSFSDRVGDQLGGTLSPGAILVQDTDQARRVEAYLKPLTRNPASLIKRHVSLASMVPAEVEQKRKVLADIEASLAGVVDEELGAEDREKVQDGLELARARPWTVEDIPAVFRNQFLTVRGKGQFVFVWPKEPLYVDRVIIKWGRELERIRKDLRAMGIPARILDQNRVGAAVLERMKRDGPWAMAYAAAAVLLLLIIDFRSPRRVALVAGTLCAGMVWMLGMSVVVGLSINVFNQAMLPTIIGVGIDNAVHIKHRYLQEGRGSVGRVLSTTGSAALLASATTAVGFGSAITAHHTGIRSLGTLAIIGVGATLAASIVFLPALLRVLEGRRG